MLCNFNFTQGQNFVSTEYAAVKHCAYHRHKSLSIEDYLSFQWNKKSK